MKDAVIYISNLKSQNNFVQVGGHWNDKQNQDNSTLHLNFVPISQADIERLNPCLRLKTTLADLLQGPCRN